MESVQWALVHCGGGWDGGQLQTHEHQDGVGGGVKLGEEDNKGAMELRKWLRERMMMKIIK